MARTYDEPMRVLAALLLVCLGSLAAEPRHAQADGGVVDGTFVRVQGSVPAHWLDVAAELGDALFEQLKSDFGREPERSELPLHLTLYPTSAALAEAVGPAAIKREEKARGARLGGYTTWDPCRSMVALQRDAFDTRRLVLHELVHQFVGRLQPASMRGREPAWYREGVAEWYGWHRRTKSGIEFGAFDVAASNDAHARIRALVATPSWSAWLMAAGEEPATYESATALVAALRGTDDGDLRSTFAAFERDVLDRGAATRSFTRLFRAHRTRLDAAVVAWWRSLQPRWRLHGSGWDERSGELSVQARSPSMASPVPATGRWGGLLTILRLDAQGSASGGVLLHGYGPTVAPDDVLIEISSGELRVGRAPRLAQSIIDGRPREVPRPVQTFEIGKAPRYWFELHAREQYLQIDIRRSDKRHFVKRIPYETLGIARRALVQLRPALIARGGPVGFSKLQSLPDPKVRDQR